MNNYVSIALRRERMVGYLLVFRSISLDLEIASFVDMMLVTVTVLKLFLANLP